MAKTPAPKLIESLGEAFGTRNGNARTTAALLSNPGCQRRAVLDAARVDLASLATRVGAAMPFGQSPFAIGQGNRFERRIKDNDHAELAAAINEQLGIFEGLEGLTSITLEHVPPVKGLTRIQARCARTAEVLEQIATGHRDAPHVVDHGVTSIDVGGRKVYLEQDALAFRHGEELRVCEVKGFPLIDRTADPEKVGAAARQTAVYVISIQDTLAERGLDPNLVSTNVLLICPKNFSLRPVAVELDVSREIRSIRRQLRRRAGIDLTLDSIRDEATKQGVDLAAAIKAAEDDPDDASAALAVLDQLPYRYDPGCLSKCDLARHCQSCARTADDPSLLGGEVAALLGGVSTMAEALALIDDDDPPEEAVELAEMLKAAKWALDEIAEAP